MPEVQPVYRLWCGIDVAAKSLTISWITDHRTYAPPLTLPSTPEGITQLHHHLAAMAPPAETLVVLEATGSYWVRLAVALHAAGFHVRGVNPKQTHHWAKSLPRRGKTDGLDARMLTQ
jgi:transposase